MVTLQQISEILKDYQSDIGDVTVSSNGYVLASLGNPIDPNKYYPLSVEPNEQEQTLRISVSLITSIPLHIAFEMLRDLAQLNHDLPYGCVGTDFLMRVSFSLNHVCSGDDRESSPQFIKRLLDESIKAVRKVENIVLFRAAVEAGIPETQARQAVDIFFEDGQEA